MTDDPEVHKYTLTIDFATVKPIGYDQVGSGDITDALFTLFDQNGLVLKSTDRAVILARAGLKVTQTKWLDDSLDITNQSAEILRRRRAAQIKHGDNGMEAMDTDDPRWWDVLLEEIGELAHERTYDSGGTPAKRRDEAFDIATVMSAWISAMDRAGRTETLTLT